MIDYQIAIPSFRRTETLAKATLSMLKRHQADFSNVTIFTANKQEEKVYKALLEMLSTNAKVVTGEPGIGKQRIFINKHYPVGTRILSLDDDIYSLLIVDQNKKLGPCDWSIDRIAFKGFSTCEKVNAKIWGINPVENGFFMDRTTSIGLRYICANFFGSYAGDPVWTAKDRLDFSSGEDFESTLRSFVQYKGVVRLDGICPKTKYFAQGGICAEIGGEDKRKIDHHRHLTEIASRFPHLCKTYKKSDGTTNIKLKPVTRGKIAWL